MQLIEQKLYLCRGHVRTLLKYFNSDTLFDLDNINFRIGGNLLIEQ